MAAPWPYAGGGPPVLTAGLVVAALGALVVGLALRPLLPGPGRARLGWVAGGLVGALLVTGAGLGSAVGAGPGQTAAGDAGTAAAGPAGDPMAGLAATARAHPRRRSAWLDLGAGYLAAGRTAEAVAAYRQVLTLDRSDPEALSQLGYLLFLLGRPEQGLEVLQRALASDPGFPQALFYKGVVLLDGLGRPGGAMLALQGYLDAAPFGGRRAEATRLLRRARRAASSSAP